MPKDKNYDEFQQALNQKSDLYKDKTIKETLDDQSELYYYAQKLNEELRKKDPENFDQLVKDYGYNKDRPLSPTTRVKGAKNYVAGVGGKKFDKSLSIEEQKNILGDDWDRYAELKKTYGANLNLFGENENPDKPETWRVGARHAVAMNPVSYQHVAKEGGNIKANYQREVTYDPTQENAYVYKDKSLLDQQTPSNTPKTYTRTIARVGSEYDNSGQRKTDTGVVWTQKGNKYYKYYTDGSKEAILQSEYEKWIGFNKAPASIKQQVGTETVPMDKLSSEQKKKAELIMAASDNQEE
jgi:hypothetical protein